MDSFTAEMLPHLSSLRRAARRLPGDPDDLVQETLLRALRAQGLYRPGSNAGGWLHRILTNVAISEHRRCRRQRALVERLVHEPVAANDAPAPQPQAKPLGGALDRLLPAERQIIELCDLEGLLYREAAVKLGCPLGTVMSRLHRARRRLRAEVARLSLASDGRPPAAAQPMVGSGVIAPAPRDRARRVRTVNLREAVESVAAR